MLTAPSIYPIALGFAAFAGWRGVARRLPAGQIAARVLLAVYLGWLIGATLFPLPLQGIAGGEGLAGVLNHPNFVPFATIGETLALPGLWPRVRLLGGNVLVFAPVGLLLPTIWPRLARLRRIALAGLLVSLSLELGQLAVSLLLGTWYRMSDIDDVLLNVGGVLLGYELLLALRRRSSRPPVA
ncbi:MAG: VanZ family protein [Thermoleophilia bacterium]